MKIRTLLLLAVIFVCAASVVVALNPDDELWIPAAARGEGNGDSFWMTDLYVLNLGEEEVTVEITWLERFADNTEAEGETFDIEGGATLVLEDVIFETFGEEAAQGAIHIEVEEDEGEEDEEDEEDEEEDKVAEEDDDDGEGDEDDLVIVANARIYSTDGEGETVGQGFEGLMSDAAIDYDEEDEEGEPTHVVGVTQDDDYRSNWYGLNITMDDETDEPEAAEVMVEVLDLDGEVLASKVYVMDPLSPVLYPLSDLGVADLENGTVRFTMIEGEGLFGVSKIDRESDDPTTLEAHWECEEDEDGGGGEFTDEFFTENCTFETTGDNPFWPLVPGRELVLSGEEDGEEIEVTITVLEETFVVDGVETRVVQEYEEEDGEVVEISRNYLAVCAETGSVFYFGEHVDDYEDGEVVGHDGEWLAGENGAEAGIIMPGTFLLGSRYMQEIAPGVAMDRADHVEMGLEIETEAGVFEDCVRVDETSPLEPGDVSVKVYCPGVGMVIDEDIELESWIE